MTDDLAAIRRRLDAIEGTDWTDVTYEREAEFYGDWARVGPVMMLTYDDTAEEKRQQEAVVDFLRHAANDIRALLDTLGRVASDNAG